MANSFSRISSVNVRLDTKVIKDGGTDVVTNAALGKPVTFTKAFKDIKEIQVTALGDAATKRSAFYSFTDIPNPTTFTAFIVDETGAFQTGTFSWHAEGV